LSRRLNAPKLRLRFQSYAGWLGVSSATFYKWRAKFDGMDTSMVARMKVLKIENARLRKMYAEERLKAETLNEVLTKK
jgi:putative transposase